MEAENLHKSVLLNEIVEMLAPRANEIFVDCTLGLGGHTEAILQTSENAQVIGIDQDAEAIELAKQRLGRFGERIKIFHANFAEIKDVLKRAGVQKVNGVLADLGVSSLQFDNAERGFSFRFDAPLDMRMNPDSDEETAAELLERLSEEEIADLIYQYGEERMSRRIARRIVWKREIGEPMRTTKELAETVEKAIGRKPKDKIHPATRTFQALRIAVNHEIEILEEFIRDAVDCLKSEGKRTCPPRLPQCVCGATKKIEMLTRKPVVPGEIEKEENPRARSAKLRVCQKI
jgi:16S rRNA (cytosine1402-N4)-methyltransferase